MLVYHPIFDMYHCIFRMLCLLENIPNKTCHIDHLRILDFYFLFPSQLNKVTFPNTALSYRRRLHKYSGPYESIQDPYKIFHKMESIQLAAINCLASCGLLSIKALKNDTAERSSISLPSLLSDTIDKANKDNADLIEFLTVPFYNLDFYGDRGIKARTGLLEYRYDTNEDQYITK